MFTVEQGPDDAESGLVTEELEHADGRLELARRGNHTYLRIHADILARNGGGAGRSWGNGARNREGSLGELSGLNET